MGEDRREEMAECEPMNLKVHSGGIMDIIWAYSAGRCLRGRFSTRKATFFGS